MSYASAMLSKRHHMSIGTKLVILLLVFGLVPLLTITPVLMREMEKSSTAVLSEQEATAGTVAEIIDRNLYERYGDVQSFALNPMASEPSSWGTPLSQTMNKYVQNYGMYHLMMVVDMQGKPVAISTVDAEGHKIDTSEIYNQNFKDEEWFKRVMARKYTTGKTLTGTVVEPPEYNTFIANAFKEDGYVMPFAAPVHDASGKMVGVWVNYFDFDIVDNIVAHAYDSQKKRNLVNTEITVLDAKGNVIVDYDPASLVNGEYHRNPEVIGKLNLVDKGVDAAQEAVKGNHGGSITKHARKGIMQAAGYAHSTGVYDFPGMGWSVLVRTPEEEAFAALNETKHALFGIAIVAALVISGLGLWLGRRVSKPMRKSVSVMQAMAKGDVSSEIDEANSNDEIGEMVSSLGTLKDAITNNTRMNVALGRVSSPVMMADADNKIFYMNDALTQMMRVAESEIKKYLPNFTADGIIGSSIDKFHKNPAHQKGMVEKMADTFKTSIQIGDCVFGLIANPIFDKSGKKLGTVVEWQEGTARAQVEAIGRSQAVIEFQMDGTVVYANENFLNTLGYTLAEVKGKHHSLFVDAAYKASPEYKQFWENLNRGEYQAGEFCRMGKGGKEVWIQASYNPIMGLHGRPVRVIKYATDVTQMVTTRIENEKGMNESVRILKDVAAGDLTQGMKENYAGTFNDIKKALNATVDKLTETVIQIKEASHSVNLASTEISAGSGDLSQRTEQQAASLEETAASMEELTGTVKLNSENAEEAAKISAKARELAEKGGSIVKRAVSAMGEIEKSSKKVSDIIGVIDEIAFQTNLLALNAAVEAARAGDAGKGFAVVATEVRSLAGRSASASKEIKSLIIESGNQVQAGASLVNEAGKSLEEIVAANNEVNTLVSNIAEATKEQSTGIAEINTAVSQMDEATQQNAALVEENTAAAGSLVDQANQLNKLVSFFMISKEKEEAMAAKQAAAPSSKSTLAQNLSALGKGAKALAGGARLNVQPRVPPAATIKKATGTGNGTTAHKDNWEEF